jgi:hypothetical protein
MAAAGAVGAAMPASAQVRVLDEGSFTISRGDTRVGREDFAIRATADPTGPLAAQGTTAIETRRLVPALSASASGVPVAYQLEVREGRTVTDRWTVQVGGGRAVSRRRATGGESSSEFPVPNGALLLDDDIAHHVWFILRRARGGALPAIPVIRPRAGAVGTVSVEDAGRDSLRIGGVAVVASHWRLRADWPGGSRDVWTDGAGRVLQVVPSAGGMRFVRDELPARIEPSGGG